MWYDKCHILLQRDVFMYYVEDSPAIVVLAVVDRLWDKDALFGVIMCVIK